MFHQSITCLCPPEYSKEVSVSFCQIVHYLFEEKHVTYNFMPFKIIQQMILTRRQSLSVDQLFTVPLTSLLVTASIIQKSVWMDSKRFLLTIEYVIILRVRVSALRLRLLYSLISAGSNSLCSIFFVYRSVS